ncbi:MAG: ribosomal protein S18-alanine N-acetyltransferase [Hamadaea sp.]|uniref:ribosomal protein S18-alanine N-acetyltransferase n=1 Tax=Hamadaea sp. NPDC050747 TaxID=3155789 RepID=UPI00182CA88B|nr:ribosomal protein S18-alanine N-acetyltransferase [Hamadaea sp.]NUR47183.1 ribosomal protein S18-alanine N-acetyltransferase [Hamadaea sp.]NUT03215.1 ribosomal protein S18-alanine N-acetyltransferase [Hamadaea sp.]
MTFQLGRLRWWQIADLLPIEADLFGAEAWTAGMFWNELANGHLYLAATEDGAVLGYGGLALSPPDEAWINNVAVRRDAQRRGIGRALVAALLDVASRAGIDQTLLEVAADNKPAQALYADFGFETVGVRKRYYQPSNTDAWVMRRIEP